MGTRVDRPIYARVKSTTLNPSVSTSPACAQKQKNVKYILFFWELSVWHPYARLISGGESAHTGTSLRQMTPRVPPFFLLFLVVGDGKVSAQ